MQERLKLDLFQKTSVSQGITTRVNDGGVHSIQVAALAYGDAFDITGWKILFELTTSAKTIAIDAVNTETTDPKNGEFIYTIPKEITGVAGIVERAYFAFEKDDKRITSADIDMTILQIVDITAEEAKSYIAEYNELVEKLNQAFKDAVDQMDADYAEIDKKIKEIKEDIGELNNKIQAYQQSVKETADEAISTINTEVEKLLKKLEAGDFYTKTESDTKFQGYQSIPIMAQDWNTVTRPGVYYVNNATGANKPDSLATTMYGFLEVTNNQFSSNAIVQRFTSFNNEICTRCYSGNPASWGEWELTVTKKSLLDLTYPVGAIYQSVKGDDPAELFGGIWVRFGEGKTLVSLDDEDPDFDSAEKTGGSKTEKLTTDQLPSHQLSFSGRTGSTSILVGNSNGDIKFTTTGGNGWGIKSGAHDHPISGTTDSIGRDQPHNNMQPYVVVYMWVRTA